jgi:hypothetical protein
MVVKPDDEGDILDNCGGAAGGLVATARAQREGRTLGAAERARLRGRSTFQAIENQADYSRPSDERKTSPGDNYCVVDGLMQILVQARPDTAIHPQVEFTVARSREAWAFQAMADGSVWLLTYRSPAGKWSLTDGCCWDADPRPAGPPPMPSDVVAEALARTSAMRVPCVVIPVAGPYTPE